MSKTVTFILSSDALALYDLNMRRTVEPGKFKVFVGGSSVGGLETEFEITE